MTKILVEGWRFLPHSFATVNQFQCLDLLQRPGLQLYHRDAPYWNHNWKPVHGLLSARQEQALRDIPAPDRDEPVDVLLRTGCPFDFSPGNCRRTITFATCEFGVLSTDVVAAGTGPGFPLDASLRVMTPSHWSREGLIRSGLDESIISVIPHGFDPGIFSPPTAAEREQLRRKFGWQDYFVFLNISAMTSNKGIAELLYSLHEIAPRHKQARLVLKGLDSLYQSTQALNNCLGPLPAEVQNDLKSRVAYMGQDRTFREIADLYKAADAYVAPYLGEGFNLPVLEALACGLPVVCTAGGPTDDFTTAECALYINSTRVMTGTPDKPEMIYLRPDRAHLTTLMDTVISDRDWRMRAREAGAAHVHAQFTWKHTGDRLEALLLS